MSYLDGILALVWICGIAAALETPVAGWEWPTGRTVRELALNIEFFGDLLALYNAKLN
jgi:hypothetical protein